MKQKELNKLIDLHELWLETNGKQGQRLELYEKDLSGLEIIYKDLTQAYLFKCNCSKMVLIRCKFYQSALLYCNFIDTYFRNNKFNRADLTGSGFVTVHTKGYNGNTYTKEV